MQSRDLYDAIRTSFPVEVQPQVISALRQDSMVWEAVNDQILLNRLVAIPDALLAKWNPATIALVAIDQFPLIKILSEGYETPLSEDLLKNSSVVYQRLTSPLSKPKNIVDAAYVSLWLREKRRSSGSWQGILPFVTVNDPQTLDTDLMSRWQTVLNILVSLVPDSDALQEMILDKSQGQQVYQILNETVFSSPSSVQEYIKQLYELIQKLDLSNQVNWLMGLNARGHADIVIAIAQMLLDLVNYEGSSEDPKRKLDASQIEDQFSIASLMQFAGRNNEAVDVLENLGSTLKNWTQSLVVKMVDADRSTLTAIRQKNIDLAEFDLPHRQRLALLLHGVTEQDEVLSKLDTNLLDPLVQLEIAQNALDGGNQEMARALAEQAITKLNEISNEELLALNHQSISRRSSNDAVKVLMNVELMSEAYQFATRLLDIRPNDPELIELAAMICQRTNDVHGVLDHASVGLILQPDSSKWHRRIAIAHETQEDWTRAYDSWKNVLKLEGMPSNSDIESFARCAYACGDYQGCISKCVKLLEESPDNGYAYQWIGTSAYQLGKYQEAIKSLIRSTALSPGEALGWLFLSESYIKLGDKRKALDVLRSAVLEVPASSELNYKLARLYLDFGLETDALPLLKSAAKLAPKDRSITTDLVQVLINLGFLKDARSVVENARMIWSQDAGLAEAHVYVLTALGDTQEALDPLRLLIAADDPKAEWLLQYAEVILGPECILLSHGFDATTIEEAASALAKVIAARPDNRKANILLAEVVASKGNYAEAYERYKKIIDTGSDEKSLPDLARRIRVGFGVVALKLGQFDFAVALLQEAANKRPNDIAILKLLAEALFAGDSKNEGMDIAKRVVNLEPINLEILEWFANAAIMAGYYTEALTALKTGVQYDALSGSRWLQMARIQTQVGDHEGASDTLSEFMKLAVVETDEYMEAGEIGLRLGDHELADMCYTRALETQDDPAVDLIFRASIVKIMNGDPENALGLIQMAVEKEPGNLPTLIIEADLLSYLDRTQAAMAVLEHAVEIVKDADDSEQDSIETQSYSIDLVPLAWLESLQSIDMVHARLSRLYLSVGKYDLAIKHAKQAIEHKKDNLDHLFFAIGLAFSCLNDALVEELITQYHQAISITDQTKYASSRIGVIALEALRTFEKGENIGALKLVNELVELSPDGELTKLLEIRSITTTGAREDALASLNDVYQLYDVQTNGIDTKNLFTQFETHNSVLDRNWFAIGAALDLYAWDVVNKILIDIQNSSTRNPRSDLYRAKALVVMAEDQVFFNELDCVSHTPDILAKSPEVASEINRILEPLGTVNEKETKRWTARIDCLLNTGEAQLNGLKEAALDAGDAAAIVAGYRRMKSFDVSEDVKRWMDDPNVLAQLAYSIQSTDGEQAIKLIQKAINNRPNDPILMRCLAMIYESNQNDQLSYAAIQNAIKWWDDEYKWLMTASDIARRLGDLPAAILHAEKANKLNPESIDAQVAYADLCLEVGKPVEAIKAIKQQLPDESIGDNKRVLDKLSAAYLAAEEYDNAIRAAMICSDKFGTSSDNLWILAQANQANNNLPETIKALRQLVRLDPMHEEGILLLANLLSMTGVPEDALATLEKAVSAHENSLAIQQERCKLIWRLHGVHKVIPILKNLVARHPDSSEISTMLAEAMEQAGDLSGAESIATAGLKKNPAITELNAIMGRIQYRAGQLDRAISYLSEAIRQSPGTLQNYLDLANVYLDRREPLQALRVYQSAIRAIPNDPQAYLEAAKILKDCRDYIGAETMLRKAAELSPEDVNIRRQLGAIIALNLVHHAKEVGSPS